MSKSFRRVVTTRMIGLVIGSLLLMAIPLLYRLYDLTAQNAVRELRLVGEQAAMRMETYLHTLRSGAVDLASSQDVARGVESALFQPYLETVIAEFVIRHPAIAYLQVYDRDLELIATNPIKAMDTALPVIVENEIQRIIVDDPDPTKVQYQWFYQQSAADLYLLAAIPGLVGRLSGFIVMVLPMSHLQELAEQTTVAGHSEVSLGQMPAAGDKFMMQKSTLTLDNPFRGERIGMPVFAFELKATRYQPVRVTIAYSSALTLGIIAMCGLIGLFSARRMTQPLTELRAQLDRYSGLQYSPLASELRYEEITALDRALADMASRISTHVSELTEQERIKGEMAKAQIEAELVAMRAQMNPHFLFNALNSIGSMAMFDATGAVKMLQKMADLYRAILESSKRQTHSLREETAIVTSYLELETMRFGKRLTYQFDLPENIDEIHVPGLVIQTLVENAVKHGIATSRQPGWINIVARAQNEGYLIRIENSRPEGAKVEKFDASIAGTGTGLDVTRKRLSLVYGKRHDLTLSFAENKTTVTFWVSGARDYDKIDGDNKAT